MKNNESKIYPQHAENVDFINRLAFYKDEIGVMQKRIEEIAVKNNAQEVNQQIEHFQNQLIVQRNNIDVIRKKVKTDDHTLENNINSNPVAADHRKVEDHAELRDTVESFEHNFNSLRKEMNSFLSKWM